MWSLHFVALCFRPASIRHTSKKAYKEVYLTAHVGCNEAQMSSWESPAGSSLRWSHAVRISVRRLCPPLLWWRGEQSCWNAASVQLAGLRWWTPTCGHRSGSRGRCRSSWPPLPAPPLPACCIPHCKSGGRWAVHKIWGFGSLWYCTLKKFKKKKRSTWIINQHQSSHLYSVKKRQNGWLCKIQGSIKRSYFWTLDVTFSLHREHLEMC